MHCNADAHASAVNIACAVYRSPSTLLRHVAKHTWQQNQCISAPGQSVQARAVDALIPFCKMLSCTLPGAAHVTLVLHAAFHL